MANIDTTIDLLEYLNDCEIGETLEGYPVYSVKKISKKFRAIGYDPYDAIDTIKKQVAPLLNSRGVIFLNDLN